MDLRDTFMQGFASPLSVFVRCETNPVVSIVMPVYNQGDVLEETLASIASQTFIDFELLCIDDGSRDCSMDIIEKCKKFDDRIHLFRLPHEGAAKARNFGFSQTVGKYITFLDSDDLFRPDYLECMVYALERTGADMCICESDLLYHDSGRVSPHLRFGPKYGEGLYVKGDFGRDLFQIGEGYPWNKMFRRDFLMSCGASFQDVRCFNDALFAAEAIWSADTVYLVDKSLVEYRRGLGTSIQDTRFFFSADAVDVAEAIFSRIYDADALNPEELLSLQQRCVSLLWAAAQGASVAGVYSEELHERIVCDIHKWGIDVVPPSALGRKELVLKLLLLENATCEGVVWAHRHWRPRPSGRRHALPQKIDYGARILAAVIAGKLEGFLSRGR